MYEISVVKTQVEEFCENNLEEEYLMMKELSETPWY